MAEKPTVFISYAHSEKESEWVRQFSRALKELGVDPWLDEERIGIGESLRDSLEAALRTSHVLVFLIDPDYPQRPNLFFELGAAVGMGKRIIPIVPKDLSPTQIPSALRTRRFLVRDDPQDTANRVASAVAEESAHAEGGT